MNAHTEIETAVARYIEAMNTDNPEIIPLAAEVVMRGPMMPEPIRGKQAVRQHLGETAPFMARLELKKTVIENENAALVIEFEGLNGVVIEGAIFFQLDDGLISNIHAFFDTRPIFEGAK